MMEMQCMLQISSNRLLMAGHQDKMIDFNLQLAKETESVSLKKCIANVNFNFGFFFRFQLVNQVLPSYVCIIDLYALVIH